MSVLPTEHTFTREYKGRTIAFTFKLPTMMERTKIGLIEARMREGVPASEIDDLTLSLMGQICYLKETVTNNGNVSFGEHTDPYLMNVVFKECLDYEARFLESSFPEGVEDGI